MALMWKTGVSVRISYRSPRGNIAGTANQRVLARTSIDVMNRPVTAAMALTETATTILELSASSIQGFLETQGPNNLTVVDFYTTWCGPCKIMAPEFEKMAQDFDGITFAKFDCGNEGNKQFAIEGGIKALPTFHMYRGAQKVDELAGAKIEKLKKMIKIHATM